MDAVLEPRVHIGILNASTRQQGGGHLSEAIIAALVNSDRWSVTVFNQDTASPSHESKTVHTEVLPAPENLIARTMRAGLGATNSGLGAGRYAAIRDARVTLLIATPTASTAGLSAGVPYVVSIADMMHCFYPDLPEFPWRERLFRWSRFTRSVRSSLLTVTDSECGREHVARLLGVSINRTYAAPFIPPPHVFRLINEGTDWAHNETSEYNLPERFLFYPAQTWTHKNHVRLLRAVRLASWSCGESIQVVLAGSRRDAHDKILKEIQTLGMQRQVRMLGYVPDNHVVALYKRATGVVFPSLFGPTNIPIAEAIVLGVPLACSRLFAMPWQAGGAALLFDPFSESDMAQSIAELWGNEASRRALRQACANRSPYFSQERFSTDWKSAVELALSTIASKGGT